MRHLVKPLLVFGLIGAACSGDDEALAPIEDVGSTTAVSEEEDNEPTTTEASPPVAAVADEVAQVWTDLLIASGLPNEERGPAIEALGSTVPADFAEIIADLVDEAQESRVWPHPIVTVDSAGNATIRDCAVFDPPVNGVSSFSIEAGTQPDEQGGWFFDHYDRLGVRCIPGEVEDAIIADYLDGNDAAREFNDPPNPDHPRIAETNTGDLLESTRQTQAFLIENGWQLRIDLTGNPEVIDILSVDEVIVRDCVEIGPDGGLFDNDGNPVPEYYTKPKPGQRDTETYRMKRENGKWKTAAIEQETVEDSDCPLPPTPAGLERID